MSKPPGIHRTLLVEDDAIFGEFLKRFLTLRNHAVVHARSADDALAHIRQQEFDYVVCDLCLPCLPGHLLYRKIRNIRPELCSRFVLITGTMLSEEVKQFFQGENVQILQKPFHVNELFSLLANLSEAGPTGE